MGRIGIISEEEELGSYSSASFKMKRKSALASKLKSSISKHLLCHFYSHDNVLARDREGRVETKSIINYNGADCKSPTYIPHLLVTPLRPGYLPLHQHFIHPANRQNPAVSGTPYEMIFPPYSTGYIATSAVESSPGISRPTDGESHHQRASSDSFLIQQLSWLEELLDDEPDSPLCKGHRRSSSDSVAFLDTGTNTFRKEETKLKTSAAAGGPSWEFQIINYHGNSWKTSFHSNSTPPDQEKKKPRESPLISMTSGSTGVVPSRDSVTLQHSAPQEPGVGLPLKPIVKQNQEVLEASSDINPKPSSSKTDSKRAKQQFAQRSRLRKLQYIAELERSAEGSQASANLEYLNRQILILGMENRALRQRLDSLSQEQLAKYRKYLDMTPYTFIITFCTMAPIFNLDNTIRVSFVVQNSGAGCARERSSTA
ncbi:unnamed protein product [Dovyalis caffra]|uniref:BZIP domain-containing protein n=1 Tax=Dovyalis caffra TaxID=77055 RepID=A0AAV1RM75_9ROSI|nr:unnamed protein product [Dovyalis caffra]